MQKGETDEMAMQLFLDLYDCDSAVLNDLDAIRKIAHQAISEIPAQIVEECCHQFQPIGITYIAVITTSHFSIHTWPEYGYAAVDVFSCHEGVPSLLADRLRAAFGAKQCKINQFERCITGGADT